jgi:hypothetical protein
MFEIMVAGAPDGSLTYAIPCPPEALPAVAPAALLGAWEAARAAAAAGHWGTPRHLLFQDAAGAAMRIAIADRDACCWAEAVDRTADLATPRGLALCLRLLALIEVLGRSRALGGLFRLSGDGVDLHPALLRAAAAMPLDSAARFDAEALGRLSSRGLPAHGAGLDA